MSSTVIARTHSWITRVRLFWRAWRAIMPDGIKKIEHLVVLMMENRSFDHYFGNYSLNEGRVEVEGLTATTAPLKDVAGNDIAFWDMGAVELFAGYADPPH